MPERPSERTGALLARYASVKDDHRLRAPRLSCCPRQIKQDFSEFNEFIDLTTKRRLAPRVLLEQLFQIRECVLGAPTLDFLDSHRGLLPAQLDDLLRKRQEVSLTWTLRASGK